MNISSTRGLAVLFAAALLAVAPGAWAARVALVIGNASYADSPLKNPVNDARAMDRKLASLGFKVQRVENLKRQQIGRTISAFASTIRAGDEVVVFYAGHGVQVKGINYLPAVDAEIQSEEDVPLNSMNLNALMDRLEEAKAGLKILFLDACRNNPFARSFRSSEKGLARVSDAASGTLIHFATRPGRVASDGDGANGLYTTQLLKHIGTANMSVESMLKRVSYEVETVSKGQQEPWSEGSIKGEFYFSPGAGTQVASALPQAPAAVPSGMTMVPPAASPMQQAALTPSRPAAAQDMSFPARPIRLVVPFVAGGSTDIAARSLATNLSQHLGQPVVIDNRPGAGGMIGAEAVAKSSADGYTILFHNISMAVVPAMASPAPFDPVNDFEPLGVVAEVPMMVAVPPQSPLRSLSDLAGGRQLTAGNGGSFSASHLCALSLQQSNRANLVMVPYKGTAPALTDLMGGQLDVMCEAAPVIQSQVNAGKLRSIGTVGASSMSSWMGLYAPRGTPAGVVARLNEALKTVGGDAFSRVQQTLGAQPVADARQTPAGHRQFLQTEVARWTSLAR